MFTAVRHRITLCILYSLAVVAKDFQLILLLTEQLLQLIYCIKFGLSRNPAKNFGSSSASE